MPIKPFQQLLFKTINLNFDGELKDLKPFCRDIALENDKIVITFSDYLNVFDTELKRNKEILLDNNLVEKLCSMAGFVDGISSTQEYVFRAYFTSENIELVKSLYRYVDYLTGEIQHMFQEPVLEQKNNYIDTTKQEIIDLEKLVLARKDLLEKAEEELKRMKQENSLADDLKFEAKKKGLL